MPDQAVGQLAEGLSVGLAPGSEFVVVAPGARRVREGAKGPLVAGIGQAAVAGETGQHDPAVTRGFGHR